MDADEPNEALIRAGAFGAAKALTLLADSIAAGPSFVPAAAVVAAMRADAALYTQRAEAR